MTLTCAACTDTFIRPGAHGPIPRFCGTQCRKKAYAKTPARRKYAREYIQRVRAAGLRRDYEHAYNRRPVVTERARRRAVWRWTNDPAYRAKNLDPHAGVVLPEPYTGHRWLEMAREAAGGMSDSSGPWAEDRYDEMSEALLALLEGRSMQDAVKEWRKKEYTARHLTIRFDDWRSDEKEDHWFDRMLPPAPSAEEEALAHEAVVTYAATRYNDVHTKNRKMHQATQQPTRRKMNNK